MSFRSRRTGTEVRRLKGVFPVFLFTLASSFSLLATGLLTARQLGPQGRGTLVLLLTVSSFTMLLCTGGVNTAARVHLMSPSAPLALRDYLGVTATLVAVEALVAAAAGPVVLPAAHVSADAVTLLLLSVCGASLLGSLLLGDALYAYGFNSRASAVAALGSGTQLALAVALMLGGATTAKSYFAAFALGSVLQAATTLVVLRRSVSVDGIGFSLETFRVLLRTGTPAVGMSLGQAATFRLDRYLVGVLLDPAAVGIYSVAATATEILWLGPMSLAQVQFHGIASGKAGVSELARARRLWLGGTVALAVVMWVAAPYALDVVLGPDFEGAVTPLRILLLGALAVSSYHIDVMSLAARGRTAAAGGTALLGLALVLVGDILLIRRAGVEGAAWASVVAYLGMAAVARLLLRARLATEEAGASFH